MKLTKNIISLSWFLVLSSSFLAQAEESYLMKPSSASSRLESMQEFSWWQDWEIKNLTEGVTCDNLWNSTDLEFEQLFNAVGSCDKLVFLETFARPRLEITNGSGHFKNTFFSSPMRDAKYNNQAVFYDKWNTYGGLIEADGYKSHWVYTNGTGIGVRLGSGAAGQTASMIQTLKPLSINPGTYRISVKFKPTKGYGNTNYQGFLLRLKDKYRINSFESPVYMKYSTSKDWLVAEFDYINKFDNQVFIELEQLVTGHPDGNAVIGNVMFYKVDPETLPPVENSLNI